MKRLVFLVALATAACNDQPAAPPQGQAPGSAPTAATPAANPKTLGTTSSLTGATSPLSGKISDFQIERTDFGTRLSLAADTLFEFDKATLTPAAQDNLARAANLIRQGGKGRVTITGHTDDKGKPDYNLDLSRKRADAVAAWLMTRPGLSDRSYERLGKGETEPAVPNARADGGDDPDGRARNRRVTIDIPK